jgi:hypothetical protein
MSIAVRSSPLVIPEAEPKKIAVRAFVPPPAKQEHAKSDGRKRPQRDASNWVLLFDTETTIDARQALRFGAFQVRDGARLDSAGVFFDPETLSPEEATLLKSFAEREGLECLSVEDFIEGVFFRVGYQWRGTIVGFNLPFDLSRLALRHGSARGATMRGGFTFTLSTKPWLPKVQVKHLNSKAALIQYTKPARKPETRWELRKHGKRPPKRGAFIDLKTHAAALLSNSFSLASLGAFLEVEHCKQPVETHGGPLTDDYIGYCLNDVHTTYECYLRLRDKLKTHGLTQTKPSKILSEAGIGKGYLKEMGIRPFLEMQPDFPLALLGQTMSAYYGGRAEVRWRRTIKQVLYCDFLSMYPTVCTLQGLFSFVIGKHVTWRDATTETRAWLDAITLDELQRPESWKQLTTLVRVRSQADAFPVRAKYDGPSNTIGLNYLTCDEPLWFTLADLIASKLLTGKTPEILEAIAFAPSEPQTGLKSIALLGNAKYPIDPYRGDLFKTAIDLRSSVKAKAKLATGHRKAELDAEQLALKILANSTSYGIFVEVNVSDLDKADSRDCFGPSGQAFTVETQKSEEPGRYFHPLLATLITGAARLMLAIAERLTLDSGLDWAFCDTDSMAIAKPEQMDQAKFLAKAQAVCRWFEPLNPYEKKGSLFKTEDQNFGLGKDGGNDLAPLYCLAISAKRYVLFNLRPDGRPIIRKASAHGLGHMIAPYGEDDPPPSIPAPSVPLAEIGVARWHYDLWFQIIRSVQEGHPMRVDLTYHPALDRPAASRYGATSPDLLRWFKTFNEARDYRAQVKPFNFLLAFQAKSAFADQGKIVLGRPKRGRKPKQLTPKPIAPFSKNLDEASRNAFDRETRRQIDPRDLKTYREALRFYHLSPESKFLGGDYVDHGRTERRHIRATAIECIGKEANKWEEQMHVGSGETLEITYGADQSGIDLDTRIHELCNRLGQRKAAEHLGTSRGTLIKLLKRGVSSVRIDPQSDFHRKLRLD